MDIGQRLKDRILARIMRESALALADKVLTSVTSVFDESQPSTPDSVMFPDIPEMTPQKHAYKRKYAEPGSETQYDDPDEEFPQKKMGVEGAYTVHYDKFVLNSKFQKGTKDSVRVFDIRSGLIKGESGKQSVFTMVDSLTREQLTVDAIAPILRYESEVGLFRQLPNARITGSEYWTAGNLVSNQIDAVCKTISYEWFLTNLSNFPLECSFYLCMPKASYDQTQTAQQQWQDACTDQGLGKPAMVFTNNTGGATAYGTSTVDVVGNKPTYYRVWNQNWKVIESFTAYMGAGSSKKVFVNGLMNKYLSRAAISDTEGTYIKNTSLQWMMTINGVPLVNQTTEGTARVTMHTPEIAWVCNTKYHLAQVIGPNESTAVVQGRQELTTNVQFVDQVGIQNANEIGSANKQLIVP